jgi:hypothetical protein
METYTLGGADKVLKKLEDDFFVLALGKLFHGGRHQIELLLQIVETYLCYSARC